MDRYLAKLHSKPEYQKKRFALLASGTVTLFIFGVWSITTFGISNIGGGNTYTASGVEESSEVSPFESLRMNLAASFEALRNSFGELKSGIESVDLEVEYKDMRDGALDVYGQ